MTAKPLPTTLRRCKDILAAALLISVVYGCASVRTPTSSSPGAQIACAVGANSHAGYRTTDMLAGMHEYNDKLGVTQLDASSRKKYEVCYDKATNQLVRRDPNNLSKFVTFDTNSLDSAPYDQDYVQPSAAQALARKKEDCAAKEAKDKSEWDDPTKPVYHTATFAMDYGGNLYASTAFRKCAFHHSSYLAEGPVAAAGELKVDKGVLKSVNNESGHYHPPAWTLGNIFEELRARGLDTSNVKCSANSHSTSDPPGPPPEC